MLARIWRNQNPFCIEGWNVKQCSYYVKQYSGPQKTKAESLYYPAIPLLGLTRTKVDLKEISKHLPSRQDYSQQPKGGSNLSVHQQIRGLIQYGMYRQWNISLKKERNSDTWYKMDKP